MWLHLQEPPFLWKETQSVFWIIFPPAQGASVAVYLEKRVVFCGYNCSRAPFADRGALSAEEFIAAG